MSHPVDSILDGWFGEPLEYSENEERLRKYLYEPLRKAYDRRTAEIEAMEAAMEKLDPATIPGLTAEHRAALGRFAKPA